MTFFQSMVFDLLFYCGLLFEIGHEYATSGNRIHPSIRYRICCGFIFSTLESRFKNIRIRCRFRRMRVDGSRTRKEKVGDSKISGYVWTGPKSLEKKFCFSFQAQGTSFFAKGFGNARSCLETSTKKGS